MRIAIILALASLGLLMAVALYVLATQGRSRRVSLSDHENELAESEAPPTVEPEHSVQTEDPKPISLEPKTPVADVEIEPPVKAVSTNEGELLRDTLKTAGNATGISKTPNTNIGVKKQPQNGIEEGLPGNDGQPPELPRISPEKRGGRSRGKSQDREEEKSTNSRRLGPKPEVVCWKRAREWILGIELPEDLWGIAEVSVFQDDMRLTEDDSEETCWQLAKLSGRIAVRTVNHESDINTDLGSESFLTFRLSGLDLNRGRFVKQPSSGSYLVIAPQDWERCHELANAAPVTPEPVCLDGFWAHFFDIRGGSPTTIAFQDHTGRSIVIGSAGPRFELVGQEVQDACESLGPLFIGQTPLLSIVDGSWGNVGIVVLGEEGRGIGRWRTSFSPNPALGRQQLPDEIASRKAGWYFVRIYNLEAELISSLDFRFAAGLGAIELPESNAFPSAPGHQAATVELRHDADWLVTRASAGLGEVNVERIDEKTVLTIPPTHDLDRTQWLFGPGGGPQVEVSILIERIWWTASEEKSLPKQWTDKQFVVTREELKASSTRALWLHFPKHRWTDCVLVGFNHTRVRLYRVLATESTVAIPLRDFGDSSEMDTIGEFPLRLWVNHQERTHEASACKLVVMAGCPFDNFIAGTEEEVLEHSKANHLYELTRVLTWEEHRRRMPSLPTVIYQCRYCLFYVRADNSAHPTDAIIHHIDDVCEGVVARPAQIRFRIVEDTEEIRQQVIVNLPRIHRCELCATEFEDFNDADLWRHLIEKHKNRLWDISKNETKP